MSLKIIFLISKCIPFIVKIKQFIVRNLGWFGLHFTLFHIEMIFVFFIILESTDEYLLDLYLTQKVKFGRVYS